MITHRLLSSSESLSSDEYLDFLFVFRFTGGFLRTAAFRFNRDSGFGPASLSLWLISLSSDVSEFQALF